MEYVIYCRIKDTSIQQRAISTLKSIADPVFASTDIIFISAAHNCKMEDILIPLQEHLKDIKMDKEDIIYLIYPQSIREIGMYPLKRKGRIRLNRWKKGDFS
jgi:hypothetical protein